MDSPEVAEELVTARIYYLNEPADPDLIEFFEQTVVPVVTESGARVLASFVTDASPNTYPALPVREGEQVFVWFAMVRDAAGYEE